MKSNINTLPPARGGEHHPKLYEHLSSKSAKATMIREQVEVRHLPGAGNSLQMLRVGGAEWKGGQTPRDRAGSASVRKQIYYFICLDNSSSEQIP